MEYGLIVFLVYIVLNIIAFLAFVWDKHKAKEDMWRTKESTLIALAFFGPFGATAGMLAVRHKTQKLKFKLVYLFLVLHVIAIAYLAYTGRLDFLLHLFN
ncbi:DUF1294 domain-containing protein [Methanomassiliicoccales archaeon LGM-RCC1]|nr:DUF1294 domain-containing protein [Methanomassiliicoccales archaeon LGM-RCC1]